MIDNHIHTRLCKHAQGEVFEYVESAIKLGLTEICFTDHIPLPDDFDIAHRMSRSEFDLYTHWITKAQQQYKEIKIRIGIEADYYEGFENYTENFLQNYNFDLVIMSVHFLSHWPEGNWVFDYDFPDKTICQVYQDYLRTLASGINTGLFDVVGHIDMVKRTGDSLIKQVPEEVDRVLDIICSQGMAIEINTSGFRKNKGEPYPGFDWLPLIREKRIPVTIGSDAHLPDQVGLEFRSVYQTLNTYGIDSITLFDKRTKHQTYFFKGV